MRSITVDTRGLSFFLKLLLVVVGGVALYNAWLPLGTYMTTQSEAAPLAQVSELDREAREEAIALLQREPHTPSLYLPSGASELPSHGTYIWIDVTEQTLTTFDTNEVIGRYGIERLPEDTSADALEAGVYSVDRVEDVEISTVTKVRFPHYVKFGDRFALHGEPTAHTGVELAEPYSGSGIVLALEDAAAVASFAEPGMLVYLERGTPKERPQQGHLHVRAAELPATSATALALADLETGQIFQIKNGNDRYPIASITKLVTAAVAAEVFRTDALVRVTSGERFLLGDLLYPLLLKSDNSVAQSIAAHSNAPVFMAHMNAYLKARGMNGSSLADSSGLSPRNLSTAQDLVVLAKHLFVEKQYLLAITAEEDMTITSAAGMDWHVLNQNKLATDPHFRGGKLGFTDEAGQTSLAIFNVPLGDYTRPVAVVVLGSKDWKQDTRTLLQWLVDNVGRD